VDQGNYGSSDTAVERTEEDTCTDHNANGDYMADHLLNPLG